MQLLTILTNASVLTIADVARILVPLPRTCQRSIGRRTRRSPGSSVPPLLPGIDRHQSSSATLGFVFRSRRGGGRTTTLFVPAEDAQSRWDVPKESDPFFSINETKLFGGPGPVGTTGTGTCILCPKQLCELLFDRFRHFGTQSTLQMCRTHVLSSLVQTEQSCRIIR